MNAIVVKTFDNTSEAELAKNLLEAEGAWSMVRRGNMHSYLGGASDAALVVKEEDLEKAKSILAVE